MTFFLVSPPTLRPGTREDPVGPVNLCTAQQWSELEVVDLPECGRCGFRGGRPENVGSSSDEFIAISIDGAVHH
jgi:hypothetical protein